MLALGILTAGEGAFDLYFFGIFGLCAATFGVWMWAQGVRIGKLRAVLLPDALHLVAHRGRHLVFQRGIAEVTIPWAEIQGFSEMRTLNIASRKRTQMTYILFTNRGDFTLNDIQWDNLADLVREVSMRIDRLPGVVAPERAAALAEVKSGERRIFSVQRIFGWVVVVTCVLLAVLLFLGGLMQGFSADLLKAAIFLLFALSVGVSMIRYYRK